MWFDMKFIKEFRTGNSICKRNYLKEFKLFHVSTVFTCKKRVAEKGLLLKI